MLSLLLIFDKAEYGFVSNTDINWILIILLIIMKEIWHQFILTVFVTLKVSPSAL